MCMHVYVYTYIIIYKNFIFPTNISNLGKSLSINSLEILAKLPQTFLLGTDHLIFHGGGGAFLRVLNFFLDLTDSARLFFIESCRVLTSGIMNVTT